MTWISFIMVIASLYVAVKIFSLNHESESLKFIGLTIAAVIFFVMQASLLINGFVNSSDMSIAYMIGNWAHIICLALVLSSLAIFIRNSKPVFAQFPLLYTALPLLIVFSYYLVYDTYALKEWLLAIYQGGALLVALLMYGVYAYREKLYSIVLIGVILLTLDYILFWFVPGMKEITWVWKMGIAAGLIIIVTGYEKVFIKNEASNIAAQLRNSI